MIWYQVKLFVSHATTLSMDALHLLVGAVIFLSLAALGRRGIARWRPWLILLALEAINEFGDLWIEQWPDPASQYGESAKDIGLTMLIPTALLLLARWRPALFAFSIDDEVAGRADIAVADGGSARDDDQREAGRE